MRDNTVEIMKQWGKGKLTTSKANEELEREDNMTKEMVVKVANNGQWYAIKNGKHLTAQQTATLIARGIPYHIERLSK